MSNKNKKKKYRHYRDSIDDDNNTESEHENGNIDLIINKLENKLNIGNINSGNADVILKIPQKNEDTRRSSKISEGIIKEIPKLIENKNIKEKDKELSQENCESSLENGMKIPNNSMIDIDINVNNNLKENLEKNENKSDLILSTNNSYRNTDMNNNILSRNKLTNINENNLSKLSIHLDNSKYFLGKRNLGLISLNKNKVKDSKDNNENKKENGIKEEKEEKEEKKRERIRNFNLIMYKKKKISYGYKFKLFWNNLFNERVWRRRCRNCNIVGIIRDIFITIIIVSAIAFYATIFFFG